VKANERNDDRPPPKHRRHRARPRRRPGGRPAPAARCRAAPPPHRAHPRRAAPAPAPAPAAAAPNPDAPPAPRIVSVGPGGFCQGPGDQQAPIPPAPPRRLVPAKPSAEIADKTSLLDLNDRICRWPMGHPGEPDFHFCGEKVNPGFPYCVEHCGRAYQAQLPRGARRPPPPLPFGGPRLRWAARPGTVHIRAR
jgi:GcrA cell cycle regulator